MKKHIFPFLAMMTLLLASCHTAKEAHHHAHWSYAGETDPAHWAELEKDAQCDGKHQSPINIIEKDVKPSNANNLVFHYSPQTKIKDAVNNGHSIQFNFDEGNFIYYNGKEYKLKQLHFHEGSEHTVNGIRYPIEMHLVHVSDDGQIAVVGVFGSEGTDSQLFEFFDKFLPIAVDEHKSIHQALDLKSFLPTNSAYYSYTGSLTTPPCSENVNWIVYKMPIVLSVDEVEQIRKELPIRNYRPTQPLNGRTVYEN